MKILDWRSRPEKMITSLWQDAAHQPSAGSAGPVARSWAAVHDRIVAQRVAQRPVAPGKPLVVSVGNLALGGTGKTPVVMALAQDLAVRGHSGVVLTRGYRSKLAGPVEVQPENERAGDEARLLAQTLAPVGWRVIQARVRSAGMRHILAQDNLPDVVLLEDGHQTAGVGRDLDVVILDNWRVERTPDGERVVPVTGAVVPLGPWRESQKGAQRAQVWLLETAEKMPPLGLGGSRVLTFQRSSRCQGANKSALAVDRPLRPCLVSGIARPERFESSVQRMFSREFNPEFNHEFNHDAPLAVRLADHEPYSQRLVTRVRQAASQAGCASLVTTAKDWVKLAPRWPAEIPAYVVELTIVWGDGKSLSDLVGERF